MIYSVLDFFFLCFHSALILFNLFGWILKPLRKVNLVTLLLTGFSWVGLGLLYGLGYCPLTDWYWYVLGRLGQTPQTTSYVAYLLAHIFHIDISTRLADTITIVTFGLSLSISIFLNTRLFFIKLLKLNQ